MPRRQSMRVLIEAGCRFIFALALAVSQARAQSPDASLRGVVADRAGQPLAGATVVATRPGAGFAQKRETDAQGRYDFASLPPGAYDLKAESAAHQTVEKTGLVLSVGDRREENFALMPASARGQQTELEQLPPEVSLPRTLPVETIASSVSVVVEENKILQLPLESRNIYSLFVLQPGVTSPGAIARRGLSFSVHGQRVSGSNYLLDGIDNNNPILTGPVAVTSADAVQEFRMVNSSFSAEYGRATSFVAQVVTRAGANRFHGSLYEFLANDKLDANTFENNSQSAPKPPFHHNQFGGFVGGPIQKNKRFFTSGVEFSGLRFGFPVTLQVPSRLFIAGLPESSVARRLLTEIPPVPSTPAKEDPNIGVANYQVPNKVNTLLTTQRFDQNSGGGRDRFVVRYTLAVTSDQTSDPTGEHGLGGVFTGYPGLRPTDHFRAHNSLLGWTHSFNAGQINDFRLGWSRERISLPQPRGDLPSLNPVIQSGYVVYLPGGLFRLNQQENNNVIQFSDVFSVRRGRSALIAGIEYRRNLSNGITAGLQSDAFGGAQVLPQGFYRFGRLSDFAQGRPASFFINVDRLSSGQLRLPDLYRQYRSGDYAFFVQNDLKLSRRLSLNLGLRYEYFGVPRNTDRSRDVNFYFGPGSTIEERLAHGSLRSTGQNTGDLKGMLYRRDRLNFAPAIGLAWDPFGRARTVVRAGYAVALDRVFDTLRDLRFNTQQQVFCPARLGCSEFLIPGERMLSVLPTAIQNLGPPYVVQLDENLRTPYAQNWYFGVQQNITSSSLLEVGQSGSVGRKLISRDVVNRLIGGTELNPTIGDDTFLSNNGNSNYLALEVGLRRRFSRGLQSQVSYTYSHAIDNQSDVLEGVRTGPGRLPALATFTRQFDARLDRGNANFDQRHNLVFNAIWELPVPRLQSRWPNRLLAGWTTSVIGAYRTGFPVTVLGPVFPRTPGLMNNRADFLRGGAAGAQLSPAQPVRGGVQWLDPSVFRRAADHVGNLGRGAIPGPGFWNYDFALLRNLGPIEGKVRVQFRAELYNALNHANLSIPVTVLSDEDFGRAFYGLNRTFSRFGEFPLDNPARRIQFGLRIQF